MVLDKERAMLLNAIKQAQNNSELKYVFNLDINPKSAKTSTEAREKGNALLRQQKKHDAETHKAIFNYYCESISLAPMESEELALAYGNRSYLLLHIQKFEDSIKDIDRALKLTASDFLKAKLLCRKVECLKKLGTSNISSILKMIQTLIDKANGQDRIKLENMVHKVEALVVNNIRKVQTNTRENKRIDDDKLPFTKDYSSRVSIQYSEKYGRHLVAAKDYKPGDIIFVEKMYATAADLGSSLLSCDYCLKTVWSSIPCDYCNFSMYCSQDCRKKAWNEYHDMECSVIPYLKVVAPELLNLTLYLRILMIGIKETGSISNLQKEIEALDQRTNIPTTDFIKSAQIGINSIKNVYFLASSAGSESLEAVSLEIFPPVLICIAKYSKFKEAFSDVRQFDDLMETDDAMFLGSLLIKIMAISHSNAFGIPCDEFKPKQMGKLHELVSSGSPLCTNNNSGLSILFSHINHSCFPTVEWRYTEQKKLFIFALHPIEKNSQIFISYGYKFEDYMKSERQSILSWIYNFVCDCRACTEEWPTIVEKVGYPGQLEEEVANDLKNGKYCFEEIKEIHELVENGRFIDKARIKTLSLSITHGYQWKHPSFDFLFMTAVLRSALLANFVPESLFFHKCD